MEKKLPETLAARIADWVGTAPVKLMFQDEARFGRISDVASTCALIQSSVVWRGVAQANV